MSKKDKEELIENILNQLDGLIDLCKLNEDALVPKYCEVEALGLVKKYHQVSDNHKNHSRKWN